jgi:hypothetical protein
VEILQLVAERRFHPLALDAKHHHHVRAFDPFVHRREGGDIRQVRAVEQGSGADRAHVGPKELQAAQIGAGNPAVADIAADGDPQPLDPAFAPADRQRVEQSLRRMFVLPVAGIDHRAAHHGRDLGGCAIGFVPDHHHVRPHRVQRMGGIGEAFALLHA